MKFAILYNNVVTKITIGNTNAYDEDILQIVQIKFAPCRAITWEYQVPYVIVSNDSLVFKQYLIKLYPLRKQSDINRVYN